MDTGLHIDMHVAPDGRTTTRFQTEGIALAEVGPLIDKAIAAMRAERAEMPPSHEPSLAGDEMVLARHAAALRAGPDTLTDLACIEYAVQKVLLECRKANPNHMAVPADGATVMRWLAAAISEAKDLRQ